MFKSEKRLATVSLILIAVMVFTLLFNVVTAGNISDLISSDSVSGIESTTSTSFKKSGLSFDGVSQELINKELAQQNIASYDGERWAIVELEGTNLYSSFKASGRYGDFQEYVASAEGRKLRASIEKNQNDFLKKLDRRGLSYTYKYSYYTINNGVALKIDADAFNAIREMAGVKDVYYSETYDVPKVEAVQNNAHVYTTGIYDTSALKNIDTDGDGTFESYQGEGMVVAIIDTGIDYNHPAFSNMPTNPKLSKEDVADLIASANGSGHFYAAGGVDDLYYNAKIPFSYDYADDDTNAYAGFESHGTHVAGIVAGRDDGKVVNENTHETFTGVAPEAQLVIMKVFTDDLDSPVLGGANSVDILRAVNDCVRLGVDVINMSLGTSAGFADGKSNNFLNSIYGSVEDAGISLVVAASNDYSSGFGGGNGTNLASNPDSGTVGAPSTYQAAISVASINGQMSKYILANDDENQVAFITNSSDQYGNELDFIDDLYAKFSDQIDADGRLTFKYVLIGGVGEISNYNSQVYNRLNDKTYRGTPVAGTIALVKRGTSTFAEKVQLAMDNGADAVVIYNNVSGVIRMSLGDVENPVPACSISMDAANYILANTPFDGMGTITLDRDEFQAGPFMSDFSSWGPTPSLQLKPEITAHGGEITSAVGGEKNNEENGAYDIYSGTSMASPNMAGAVALLRQYLTKKVDSNLKGPELEARVNQLLMSTATIARNEEGNPYSPRKQGAGLADITSALMSEGYIYVEKDDKILDKTKLELGDDPTKSGVYTLEFVIKNIKDVQQVYSPTAYVMTETMASDNKTVAEKAFMLAPSSNDYCSVQYFVDGVAHTGDITVGANGESHVKVVITLNQSARDYLDANFVNGMYIEGFVSFDNKSEKGITLGIPYLGFYGDWNAAPLFDYDVFEIAESEQDTSVPEEKKLKASAAATQVVGMYYEDEMLLPLGTYLYAQAEEDVQMYPSRDKMAVSMYDEQGNRTLYEIYCVWGGLLRGAAYMDIKVTNSATGEVVYQHQLENIAKSYAAGGSGRGALIELALNPYQWGMLNNETYTVEVNGQLDYETDTDALAKNPNNGSWKFDFTVDYEAPKMTGYRVRYVPYEQYGQTKYHIWLDVDVVDNHYVQDVIPAHLLDDVGRWNETLEEDGEGNRVYPQTLTLITDYAIAVQGEKGKQSTVSFEITDYYEEFVNKGNLYIQIEDYAMNSEVYNIILDEESLSFPETIDFVEDAAGKLRLPAGSIGKNADGSLYNIYSLSLRPNELYTLNCTEILDRYTWTGTTDAVLAKGNQIYANALTEGQAVTLYLTDGASVHDPYFDPDEDVDKIYAAVRVDVAGAELTKQRVEGISFKPILNGDDWVQPASGEVELNPGMNIQLQIEVSPWYLNIPGGYTYTSTNSSVATVSTDGVLTTNGRGTATITARANTGSAFELYTAQFIAVVGEEFEVTSYTLYDYYGGPNVVIPEDINVMYLDEECFRNREDIETVVLPSTLMQIPEGAFMNCTNLREVTIPGGCRVVGNMAFLNCPNLEKIILPDYTDGEHNVLDGVPGQLMVGRYGFANCPKLEHIAHATVQKNGNVLSYTVDNNDGGWLRVTTLYDYAFMNCTALGAIDISNLQVSGEGVFTGCTNLSSVTTSRATAIGAYMFDGCTNLRTFEYNATTVPDGAFFNTKNLQTITFTQELLSIGSEAFRGAGIETITLPDGKFDIGAYAFSQCPNLTTVKLSANTEIKFDETIATLFPQYTEDLTQYYEDAYGQVLTELAVNPFGGSDLFTAYELVGESEFYQVKDGVLYSKDGSALVSVPVGKTLSAIPSDVTAIGALALAGNKITNADLSSVTSIGKYAFAQSNLRTVTLPEIDKVDDGVFFDCTNLVSVTGLDKIKHIGKFAFAFTGDPDTTGATLLNVDLVAAQTIDNYAFYNSTIENITGGRTNRNEALQNVTEVGQYAFAYTLVDNINMPNLTKIGYAAFSNMYAYRNQQAVGLESITVGGVTEMGDFAFAYNNALVTATLGAGTTAISNAAFMGEEAEVESGQIYYYSPLERVNIPTSVKSIGQAAFAYNCALETINLANVETFGAQAFYFDLSLENADLGKAKIIGDGAFYLTSIVDADLKEAEYIGDMAFYLSSVATLNMPKAKYIGSYAFRGTELEEVTIPATLDTSYVYEWVDIDEMGYSENRQGSTADNWNGDPRRRNVKAYGDGAFADISTLQNIYVDGDVEIEVVVDGKKRTATGNGKYFSLDGVLYSVLPNGYRIEQFPAGKGGEENLLGKYVIVDDTVTVAAHAFEGAFMLDEVTLPNTMLQIGGGAFYNTSITKYNFLSVKAPTLLAEYDEYIYHLMAYVTGEEDLLGMTNTEYYNNFVPDDIVANSDDLGIPVDYELFANADWVFDTWLGSTAQMLYQDFKLLAVVPKNGSGYDFWLYKNFFSTIQQTETDLPDVATSNAIKAIGNLPTVESIADIASIEDLNKAGGAAEAVANARKLYNKITDPVQLELAKDSYAALAAAEAALRDLKKNKFGQTINVTSVTATGNYKSRYDNIKSKFDPTGLQLNVVFEDGSEIVVEGNQLNFSDIRIKRQTFGEGEGSYTTTSYYVTSTYVDENNKAWDIELTVNLDNPPDENYTEEEEENKLSNGAIAGIAVAAAAAAVLIALAVVLTVLVKKGVIKVASKLPKAAAKKAKAGDDLIDDKDEFYADDADVDVDIDADVDADDIDGGDFE